MGFSQGLSGLNASSKSLDVIGNNIANSGTVGFKASNATFADVYASSRIGLGTQVASVHQRFTAGSLRDTGNQFDMAIDGEKGLFRLVNTSGNVLYSRNGQFLVDKHNQIVNAQGHRLTGYAEGSATAAPLQIPTGNIAPSATTGIDLQANFNANADVIDGALLPFDPDDSRTFTHAQPIDVFDSLGNPHQLMQYFAKRPALGTHSEWEVYYVLDGSAVGAPTPMTFDPAGRLDPSLTVNLHIPNPGGTDSPAEDMDILINYAGSTQFGGPFAPTFSQNGYATGEYASMSASSDGSLMAHYTNGEARLIGNVVLANFKNLQGMQPVGGNAWIETSASGQPILGAPGSNGLGTLMGQAVEESNVDMGEELVNMIVAQRTYQANAQTIKTQDQILQTLITLR